MAVSIVAGVALVAFAAMSAGKPGLVDSISSSVHATIDYLVAALLIAAPFLFGFGDDGGPTALFIVLGVVHLLVTIGTRFRAPAEMSTR